MSHVIVIAVPEDATQATWDQVHSSLSIIVGGSVVQSSPAIVQDAQPVQVAVLPSNPAPSQPAKRARYAKGSPEAKAAMAALRARKGSSESVKAASQPAAVAQSATERMAALANRGAVQPAAQPAKAASPKADSAQDALRFANVMASDLSPEGYDAVLGWATDTLVDPTKIADVCTFLEGRCALGVCAARVTAKGKSNLAFDIARKAGLV